MAGSGFIPDGDKALLNFVRNMSQKITAAPSDYGLLPADASALADDLAAYSTALAVCEPSVRSMPAVSRKNDLRTALKNKVRRLAKKVDADENVTDAQRMELGLNVRRQAQPISRPAVAPGTEVIDVNGPVVSVSIHDSASSTKRGKPAGTIGARLYSFVGRAYPADPAQWKFEGETTKGKFDVTFDNTLPAGTQVWICTAWLNPKLEAGPLSVPVTTNLQYAGAIAGATMKVAA